MSLAIMTKYRVFCFPPNPCRNLRRTRTSKWCACTPCRPTRSRATTTATTRTTIKTSTTTTRTNYNYSSIIVSSFLGGRRVLSGIICVLGAHARRARATMDVGEPRFERILLGLRGVFAVVVGLSVRAAEGHCSLRSEFRCGTGTGEYVKRFGVERLCSHPLSCLVSLWGG